MSKILFVVSNIISFILFQHLAGGTLLVCQLDVALNGVTLYDSQRSSLSRRNLDADTISYCGLTRYVLIMTGSFTVYMTTIKLLFTVMDV